LISRDEPSCTAVGSKKRFISPSASASKLKSPLVLPNTSFISNAAKSAIDPGPVDDGGADVGNGADAVGGRWGFIGGAALRCGVGVDAGGGLSSPSPSLPPGFGGMFIPG